MKPLLLKGSMGGINPLITAALIVGYVTVVSATPAFRSFVGLVLAMPGHAYFQMFFACLLIPLITGNATVAAQLILNSFGSGWIASGIIPDVIRPILTTGVSGISVPPHSGGLFGVLEYTGQNHKESYLPMFFSASIPSLTTTLIIIGFALLMY